MTVYLALNGIRGLIYFPIQTVLGVGVCHVCVCVWTISELN